MNNLILINILIFRANHMFLMFSQLEIGTCGVKSLRPERDIDEKQDIFPDRQFR
jgi:hypothetical protein